MAPKALLGTVVAVLTYAKSGVDTFAACPTRLGDGHRMPPAALCLVSSGQRGMQTPMKGHTVA